MRRPGRVAALTAVTAVTALAALSVGLPSMADTVVVGYVPPGVDYGFTDDGDGDADGGDEREDVAFGEVRAQGVVVNNIEPGARDLGTDAECPAEGCDYQLIVLDPDTLRADDGPVGCDTLEYGVVDPAPDQRELGGGARLYVGHGPLPEQTADTGAGPEALTAGVGGLCFATPADADGRRNDAGDGPLAATQPKPVVVLRAPDAPADG